MTTALTLNAINTLMNGEGLTTSPNVSNQVTIFKSQPTIALLANIFTMMNSANANIAGNGLSILSNIGSGVSTGQWLLDFYPSNISPTTSAGVTYYGNVTLSPSAVSTASFSTDLLTQASLPFANGFSGFANVYMNSYGYAAQTFDTVSSTNLLKNKTYSTSGIGFTGPSDLSTGGFNNNGPLIANVIASFGTMYDIKNINSFSDPYVFGQNLLNQGLGIYGNLTTQLTAAGLNVTNLSAVPQSTNVTSTQRVNSPVNTGVGQVNLPFTVTTTTTTTSSGNSVDVVMAIYESITGSDLEAIVTATGITPYLGNTITTLADYLTYSQVVSPSNISQLSSIGINGFSDLGSFIQSRLGTNSANFLSWSSLATSLAKIVSPTLNYTSTSANTNVLSSSVTSSLLNFTGTGSGPFGNFVIADFIGACSGIPYTPLLQTINQNYSTISNSIDLILLLQELQTATIAYVNGYSYYPVVTYPSSTTLLSLVSQINSALNSLSTNTIATQTQNAYYSLLNSLTNEVANVNKVGLVFNAGYPKNNLTYAQAIISQSNDTTQYQASQFLANLITNDQYGDTLRSAFVESMNTQNLGAAGINSTNDPKPALMISQSTAQNIPLSTYITQNQ